MCAYESHQKKSTDNGTAQGLCTQRHNHQLVAGTERGAWSEEAQMRCESLQRAGRHHSEQLSTTEGAEVDDGTHRCKELDLKR